MKKVRLREWMWPSKKASATRTSSMGSGALPQVPQAPTAYYHGKHRAEDVAVTQIIPRVL